MSGLEKQSGIFVCKKCNKSFSSNCGLWGHMSYCGKKRKKVIAWNKGLSKDTDERVKRGGEIFSKGLKEGKIIHPWVGRKHSEQTKKIIAEKQRIAHAEGRAHNIGKTRWNNEPSWPEIWFKKVITNEFIDRQYKTEYPFGIYSLDFAWIHKKRVIEIDGDQHNYEPQISRDEMKDKLLLENDWKILRISWKDLMKNTKFWIREAKNFIDN